MPMIYDAIHGNVRHVDDAEVDVFDERGVLREGKILRVPMMVMDSMQRSIAGTVTTVDDDDNDRSRREAYDFARAELSVAYKGGLSEGDTFRLGDRMVVVQGRNPATGKVVLADASTFATDAEARQSVYDEYDAEIQSRYLTTRDAVAGERCSTAGRESGTWREKNGRLICVPDDKSSKEFALAGPLSDEERVKVMDETYAEYDRAIAERWRR